MIMNVVTDDDVCVRFRAHVYNIHIVSCLVSSDDEHIWHHDGDAGGAAQEPEHQDVERPHGRLGPHLQHW